VATESSLKARTRQVVQLHLGGPRFCHVVNIQDRFVSGRPDTQITFNGPTSYVEFKHLGLNEKLHGALRKDQLEELIALERVSGGRAWVVVYRKGGKFLDVYRPSALRRVRNSQMETVEPEPETAHSEMHLTCLRSTGVIRLVGHDHHAVAALIRLTHESY
jgi:hypothetical protein